MAMLRTVPHSEMVKFLASVKTIGGKRDKMFAFGFDTPNRIEQTRGDQFKQYRDFTKHLLAKRVDKLKKFLDLAPPGARV